MIMNPSCKNCIDVALKVLNLLCYVVSLFIYTHPVNKNLPKWNNDKKKWQKKINAKLNELMIVKHASIDIKLQISSTDSII